MSNVTMTVNGKTVSGSVEGRTLLVEFIRNDLHLTGTHVGCDTSQCGACAVHVDGKLAKAFTQKTSLLHIWIESRKVTRCGKTSGETVITRCEMTRQIQVDLNWKSRSYKIDT